MDLEAYNQIVELVALGNEMGEAIWTRIEFWSGLSFAAIAVAHLAPNRLTPAITLFIIILYTAFSLNQLSSVLQDMEVLLAIVNDIAKIGEMYQIDANLIALMDGRSEETLNLSFLDQLSTLYLPGLYLGTVGFLIFSCRNSLSELNEAT